jgi:hypothetical protein
MERISSVDELTRKKQDFPSKNRLKKIPVGWIGRIVLIFVAFGRYSHVA